MTKTDFAELKEKLGMFDENKFEEWSEDHRAAYSFWPDIKEAALWQNLKSAAIISELIEIIKSQSEALKEVNTDNFVYDDHCTDIGDRIDQCEIETTTRLQKLRDGK